MNEIKNFYIQKNKKKILVQRALPPRQRRQKYDGCNDCYCFVDTDAPRQRRQKMMV